MFKRQFNIVITHLPVIFLFLTMVGYARQANVQPTNYTAGTTLTAASAPAGDSSFSATNPTAEKRIKVLARKLKKEGFDIDSLLTDPRFEFYDGIADRFRHAAEKKSPSLKSYKKILGFKAKKDNIVAFMKAHAEQLEKAEQRYGVPKYVISAIIGIESDFGKNAGHYNPFNSYVSMYAESYRKEFAFNQLKHLLTFVKNRNIDVFDLKSSYAGAMTFGQFIPYSMNKWFIGNDILDMNNNIMSVANYLSHFRKRTGSIKKAVYRYNPSTLYTKAVLDLANEAREKYRAS